MLLCELPVDRLVTGVGKFTPPLRGVQVLRRNARWTSSLGEYGDVSKCRYPKER